MSVDSQFKFKLQPLSTYFATIKQRDTNLPRLYLEPKVNMHVRFSLKKYVNHIYNQGRLGSCTAFAIKSILKVLRPEFEFSALFLYQRELMKDHPGVTIEDRGTNALGGLEIISTLGICEEVYCPYTPLDAKGKPLLFGKPITMQAYANAQTHKFFVYSDVSQNFPKLITTIQTCLNQGYFVLLAFVCFESFITEEVTKSGILPMPTSDDDLVGAHQVFVCGYDEEFITCVNSWGFHWGQQGFFQMPIAYLTQMCQFQGQTLPCVQQLLVMDKIQNDQFLSDPVCSPRPNPWDAHPAPPNSPWNTPKHSTSSERPALTTDLTQILIDVNSTMSALAMIQFKLQVLLRKQSEN